MRDLDLARHATILGAAVLLSLPSSPLAQAPSPQSSPSSGNAPAEAAPGYDPNAPTGLQEVDVDAAVQRSLDKHARRREFLCKNTANPRKLPYECRKPRKKDFEQALLGYWGTIRKTSLDLGITPSLSYTTQLMTNTSGTTSTGASQTLLYAGQVNGAVHLDFDRMARIPGLSLYVSAAWGTGGELSVGAPGNLFTVASAAAGTGFWLGEVYLQETLLGGDLDIAIGRLGAGSTFATLPVFGNYVNAGVNGNPAAIGINEPPFAPPPPGVEWGLQAIWFPTGNWQLMAGVYNNNPSSAAGTDHGADFRWSEAGSQGVLVLGQASYLLFQGPTDDAGPPGQYSVGGYYDGNTFPVLPNGPPPSQTGNWGVYAMFQQAVYQPAGPDGLIGLTAWGAATYTSKTAVNAMPVSLSLGLSYQGLIPSRSGDVLSAGWYLGRVSPAIPGTTCENVLEVNYQIAVNGWLAVTPDFQYVWRPSGLYVLGAAVAGVQAVITL